MPTSEIVLESGVIEIKALYDFIMKDDTNASIKGDSSEGKKYGKKVQVLTDSISTAGGFYIWGSYSQNCLWNTIYLGEAGFNKTTGLQSRIRGELKDERQFLWKIKMNEGKIHEMLKIPYTTCNAELS